MKIFETRSCCVSCWNLLWFWNCHQLMDHRCFLHRTRAPKKRKQDNSCVFAVRIKTTLVANIYLANQFLSLLSLYFSLVKFPSLNDMRCFRKLMNFIWLTSFYCNFQILYPGVIYLFYAFENLGISYISWG